LVLAAVVVWISLAQVFEGQILSSNPARKHFWKVVAVGDIACDPAHPSFNDGNGTVDECQQKAVGRAIEQENADAVLLLGDIQYDKGEAGNFEKSFVPYWRDIKSKMYVAAGNHDYGLGNLDGYQATFDTFFPNAIYQKNNLTYYSFKLGSWNLYALDSNCSIVPCAVGSAQNTWLKSNLEVGSSAKCSAAFWHHPTRTSGIHRADAGIVDVAAFDSLLDQSANDLVINGHDHHYERFAPNPNGSRQFISGVGGRSLRRVLSPLADDSENVVDNAFGYTVLRLYPSRYEWQFKSTKGEVLDSGKDFCR
jgi:acid phosphatase type 7